MMFDTIDTILRMKTFIHLVGFLILVSTFCHGRVHRGSTMCEQYSIYDCQNYGKCEPVEEDCLVKFRKTNVSVDEYSKMSCYSSWYHSNSSTDPVMVLKGCWMNNDDCTGTKECVATKQSASVLFCCCDQDMCNKKVHHRPSFTAKDNQRFDRNQGPSLSGADNQGDNNVVRKKGEYELSKTILCSIVPIVAIVILVVVVYFMWRRHQSHISHHQLPTMDPNLMPSPSESAFPVQLLEHKAKGRFGYVWKALLHDQYVAVKIFPCSDKKSYSAEVDIYKLSNMSHENILHFIGNQIKEENSYIEYLLITEYHERGSLYDFLKANTVTWAQLCRIGESMTKGLSYLHDEVPANHTTPMKPAIAHRDIKSKNVLLKSDLTACIADFGLALVFDPSLGVNETHTQVGTRRYMAPEVLEGAICFNMDSFLRIDMYACSLVLWELMTRCTCVEGVVDDYRLPFEVEVGLQPTLEEMQPLVASQKHRPAIKPAWYQSPGMSSLVTTIQDCWDQDAEARLSAGCVHDRIAQLSSTINTGGGGDSNTTNTTSSVNSTSTPFTAIVPPTPTLLPSQLQQQQQQQQQFIHQHHQLHHQHPSNVVNSNSITNNHNNLLHHHHHQHHQQEQPPPMPIMHQQQQEQPPLYVPINSNTPPVIIDSNNINNNNNNNSNNMNTSPNTSSSTQPMAGINNTAMPRDLSLC